MDNNFSDFKEYLKKNGVSVNSIKFYVSDVRLFMKWIKKTSGSEKLNKEAFESYETFLKFSNLPPQTVNRKLSSLRKFASYLVSRKKLPASNLKITNKPKNKNTKYINLRNVYSFLHKNLQSYFVFFILILIVSLILLFIQNRNKLNSLFETVSTNKLDLPQHIDLNSEDYQKNLGKVANSGPSDIKVDSDPLLSTSNGYLYGRSQIEPGSVSKKIFVPGLNTSSYVFLTPLSPSFIFISEQSDGYFVVSINSPTDYPIKFNWLAYLNELPIDTP